MSARKPLKLTGRRCQCCGCGEHFNGERGFDRHRVGAFGVNRRCLTVPEMLALGWFCNPAGFWAMSRLDSAGRARIRPAQASPARMPLRDALAPDLRKPAGAP